MREVKTVRNRERFLVEAHIPRRHHRVIVIVVLQLGEPLVQLDSEYLF